MSPSQPHPSRAQPSSHPLPLPRHPPLSEGAPAGGSSSPRCPSSCHTVQELSARLSLSPNPGSIPRAKENGCFKPLGFGVCYAATDTRASFLQGTRVHGEPAHGSFVTSSSWLIWGAHVCRQNPERKEPLERRGRSSRQLTQEESQ